MAGLKKIKYNIKGYMHEISQYNRIKLGGSSKIK